MIEFTVEKKAGLYYPKIVRGRTLTMQQVAETVAEKTGIYPPVVYAFICAFGEQVRRLVCESYIVEVKGVGIFSPSIKSKSVSTAEELTARSITYKGVNYRPSVKMKKKLKEAEFKRVE